MVESKNWVLYFTSTVVPYFSPPQNLGKGNGFQRVIATGKLNWDSEINMIHDLMYIELKTGYSNDGPAWIGYPNGTTVGELPDGTTTLQKSLFRVSYLPLFETATTVCCNSSLSSV